MGTQEGEAARAVPGDLARSALEGVFSALGIKTVICVDDAHVLEDDSGELVIAAVEQGAVILTAEPFAGLDGLELTARYDSGEDRAPAEAAAALRVRWDRLPGPTRSTLVQAVRALTPPGSDEGSLAGADVIADESTERQLANLLGATCDYFALTLAQWRAEGRRHLKEGESAVVLFDRDFTNEGGGDRDGERELQALIGEGRPQVWCGLLTHTVERDQEIPEWERLSAELGVAPAQFLVISKRRIVEEPDSLARMLRLTIVAPDLYQLRELVVAAREAAHATAAENLRNMNVYTIEAAIQSAAEEGTWEPDMLLSLMAALERDRAQEALRENTEVLDICDRLRDAQSIKLPPAIPQNDLDLLRRLDIYDDVDHVNRLGLPLEPGDIFSMTHTLSGSTMAEPRTYVLLGQSCDLAVRKDGHRAYEAAHLEVAEIKVLKQPSDRAPKDHELVLPLFDASTGQDAIARLASIQLLPSLALDACVLNADGSALLQCGSAAPRALSEGWKRRHQALCSDAETVVEKYEVWSKGELAPDDLSRLLRDETGVIRTTRLWVQVDVAARTLTFGLRRAGRLREPWAHLLMMVGAHRKTRVAFEPSFVPSTFRK